MEHAPAWLTSSLIYLGAAVLVVPLSKFLGLGSIIGYLVAGIAIGPWGLGLVSSVEDVLHFAEFGVVLMLFLVGLELEPKRLWNLRRPIFGWGAAQVLSCAAVLFAVGCAVDDRRQCGGPRRAAGLSDRGRRAFVRRRSRFAAGRVPSGSGVGAGAA